MYVSRDHGETIVFSDNCDQHGKHKEVILDKDLDSLISLLESLVCSVLLLKMLTFFGHSLKVCERVDTASIMLFNLLI